ncbi:anthranilate synthase family protein [Paractinoplanes globisporus]|uniref:anthranilate synthase n=1 Tax=Paractinoplanes globisporus TaxID=113565 RepID=A0ABW6WSV8_9ACTN|nr:anthranilate synthase family protein [Actinoplanes globisporus]
MAFAFLHRPAVDADRVEIITGEASVVPTLAALPLSAAGVLAVVPFRQIGERGLTVVDDGTPLVAIRPDTRLSVPLGEALRFLPRTPARPSPGAASFDLSDDAYAAAVRTVLKENIARGDGSNFVLRRTCRGRIPDWSPRQAMAAFRRLLLAERGAYWTFLVHWNGRTLLGATPECQVRVAGGVARMTPISGTYRYPPGGPTDEGLRRFLDDPKETGELLMVVDEELKMMARICPGGGRVDGPRLRMMSRLAHTEYAIEGPTDLDVREVLRLTLPAPTVSGSPVANACRVIAGHERSGRGYYGGALALAAPGDLDSALVIRAAEIDADGRFTIGAGATLVKGSDPAAEAQETRAKASALLGALLDAPAGDPPARVTRRVPVAAADGLSTFWRGPRPAARPTDGRRLVIINAEDDFTDMLARMAESLGVDVRVVPWRRARWDDADVVLIGPGPGDPRNRADERVDALHRIVRELLGQRMPLLAVCLGHQVLADELGLQITRLSEPAQGVRRRIMLYGRTRTVGFYNSFTARADAPTKTSPLVEGPVRIVRDPIDGAVHALSATRVQSIQFHAESLLTEDGALILHSMLRSVSTSHDRLDSDSRVRQGAHRHVRH